jgi:hypothetical protein
MEVVIWSGSSGNYDASFAKTSWLYVQSTHSSIRTTRT